MSLILSSVAFLWYIAFFQYVTVEATLKKYCVDQRKSSLMVLEVSHVRIYVASKITITRAFKKKKVILFTMTHCDSLR